MDRPVPVGGRRSGLADVELAGRPARSGLDSLRSFGVAAGGCDTDCGVGQRAVPARVHKSLGAAVPAADFNVQSDEDL